MRFLYGYLLYKAAEGSFSQYRAAAETLEDLTRTEEEFTAPVRWPDGVVRPRFVRVLPPAAKT